MSVSGSRRGIEYEALVRRLMARLGFRILDENFTIDCLNRGVHRKTSHEIDIVVEHEGISTRPVRAPEGIILVECKSGEAGISEVDDTQQKLACLRSSGQWGDVAGAIIVAERVNPRAMQRFPDVACWDNKLCYLYASKSNRLAALEHRGVGIVRQERLEGVGSTLALAYDETERVLYVLLFHENENSLLTVSDVRSATRAARSVLRRLQRFIASVAVEVEIYTVAGVTSDLSDFLRRNERGLAARGIKVEDYGLATWASLLER